MDSELIELLEFAKSQKIEFVEYEGKKYNVKKYKFKKYYTVYDKNDFYVGEYNSLDSLQKFLEKLPKESISRMILLNSLIRDKYYIYPTYELQT